MPNILSTFVQKFAEVFRGDDLPSQAPSDYLFNEFLTQALDIRAGFQIPEWNPDKLLRDFGKDIARLYDLMLQDDRIISALNLKKRLILATNADIVPASDDPRAKEIAQECIDQLGIEGTSKYPHDVSYGWIPFLDNALDAMGYGFKVAEKVWKVDEKTGKTFLYNLRFRHSYHFNFRYDVFGNLEQLIIGKMTGNPTRITGQETINDKFEIFTYPYAKDGNLYGESDCQAVFEQWRAKRHIFRARNIRLQTWGMPTPEIQYDVDRTQPGELSLLEDIAKNWQEKQYLLNPSIRRDGKTGDKGDLIGKFKLTIHEARSGSDTKQYEEAIDQIDKQIWRRFLIPDKLGYSETHSGSYSIGEVQYDILRETARFMHKWIEVRVNNIIRQIVNYNYGVQEAYPVFKFSDNRTVDADMLKTLVEFGVVDPREKWVRKYADIPHLSDQEREDIGKRGPAHMPIFDRQTTSVKVDGPLPPESPEQWIPSTGDDGANPVSMKKDYRRKPGNPFKFQEAVKYLDGQEDKFVLDYCDVHKRMSAKLLAYVGNKTIVEDKDYKALDALRLPLKTEFKDLFQNSFSHWYFDGKVSAIDEVKKRLKKTGAKFQRADVAKFAAEVDWLDRAYIEKYLAEYGDLGELTSEDVQALRDLKQRGFYITGVEEERVTKLVRGILDEAIRTGSTTADAVSKIAAALPEDRAKYALTIARTNLTEYYNTARMNFFTSDPLRPYVEAYQYQAIVDDNTTDFCREHDGQVIMASDPSLLNIKPPNHFNALHPQTKISMGSLQYKEIKDVAVGDFVVTHTGKLRRVYDVMMEYRDEEINEVELENGQRIYITNDHPVMVDGEGWLNAGDLEPGMEIVYRGKKKSVRYCEACGKEIPINGKKKNGRYCDAKCMANSMRVVPTRNCEKCGKPMVSTWKHPVSRTRRFCSQSCYFSHKGRTSIERVMADTLSEMGIEFVEQYRIGKWYADFFIPSKKIVIEADGNYWHDVKEKWSKRIKRDATITNMGYTIFRVAQDAILSDSLRKDLTRMLREHDEAIKNKVG